MSAVYGVTPAAVYELVHVCQARAVRPHINVIATALLCGAALGSASAQDVCRGVDARCYHDWAAEFPGQRELEQLVVNGTKSAMGLIPFCTSCADPPRSQRRLTQRIGACRSASLSRWALLASAGALMTHGPSH